MARNLAWYALNAARAYPLDEAATLLSDAGKLVPSDILVDCKLTFPVSKARYAYLGAMSVTENAVTLTFVGSTIPARQPTCEEEESAGELVPLAAVSLPKAGLSAYRHYAVTPLLDGVGGWVVFGNGVFNRKAESAVYFTGKFSTVYQSMLTPRSASPYRDPAVTGVGRTGDSTKLRGLVLLKTGPDLEIVGETLTIDGVQRHAAVFQLTSTTPVGEGRNVFNIYRGPCSGRPESDTCDGQPIEQINAASPDCCGRISLNFIGCARLTPTADNHGLIIDCGIGLSDVCAGPDALPAADGTLPNERLSECEQDSEESEESQESE